MTVTVFGTSAAVPTHGRGLSATLVEAAGQALLLDCGDGTVGRLLAADVSIARLDAVCVTHMHGDHMYGLPALLTTLSMLGRTAPLRIAGPDGLAAWLAATPGAAPGHLRFPLDLRVWPGGDPDAPDAWPVLATGGLTVTAVALDHGIPTRGYRVETAPAPGNLDLAAAEALGLTDWRAFRALKAGQAVVAPDGRTVAPGDVVGPATPGVALAYILDTQPCAGARHLARGADLVLHDATFATAETERARTTHHSTAAEAAATARDAGARQLLLTHFSARYPHPAPLVREATAVFAASDAAVEGAPVEVMPSHHPDGREAR